MIKRLFTFVAILATSLQLNAQRASKYNWTADGNGYYYFKQNAIHKLDLEKLKDSIVVSQKELTPEGSTASMPVERSEFSEDKTQILLFTNSKKVWRYHTKGDYWVLNLKTNKLVQLGKKLPTSSLMFAKFSPDGNYVGYVSQHNVYVENLSNNSITQLTKDGTDRMINGTFDWAYEEEFGCRDGFRWSPDSKSIAFWQLDANKIRNFLMIDNTDSIYSFVKPVEYPVVGQTPSPTKLGVVNIATQKITWMNVPGDPAENYIPRMEWADANEIVLQQLNRKQNTSILYYANIHSGKATSFYKEEDKAWIDIKSRWNNDDPIGWDWLPDHKSFVWVSEKDGWRHAFLVSKDGKKETLLTKGNYDIIEVKSIDTKGGYIYYSASPDNATQKYLYRSSLTGKGQMEELSPKSEQGTHEYQVSPNGKFAEHTFSNANTYPATNWVNLQTGAILGEENKSRSIPDLPKVEFLKLTTVSGITEDAWIVKPKNFDSTKKYPIVFYVYTEPASATVTDEFGSGRNFLYKGDMAADGYIYVSIDGRGTPAPKGAAWRKSIYKNIGIINIKDQAEGAMEIFKLPYVDTSRVAVWGWSGGGSTTLNLLFQYPQIYKTGISIAPVANQLTYDNIYEERYMGLPQEDKQPYIQGSPITHAQGLQGKLLLVHGTGDDNVHYQNSEMLINQLIKYDKVFQFMPYPNRTHSISEGDGTRDHLSSTYTEFLRRNCEPGEK
ncbi:S9 family peptidase [Rhizosphaericola mali]|uniref:S9 family peptidase n=1 Tax=Rhizosphaericola mali TaxID=2545455 RepID=A0A5P2GEZ9_9BACT|nr:S9 family peptidase [Rhizosphaericola mali]QES90181.1 S9 family peptidase [Rhizosphaericola mali]